jgi:SAM-dependent methyltransferase
MSHSVRIQHEAEFHDRWASEIEVERTLVDETFTAVTALENQHILEEFGDVKGKRVLDYGCGAAEGGVFLAKRGATVVGVDVSANMLAKARRLAAHHDVQIETRRVEGDRIPADDEEFDLIYGNGVLHHVPHDTAIPELARILKHYGKGCFIEPLPYNPLIKAYRKIAKEVRTPDERPISFRDLEMFSRYFAGIRHREFWFTTLAVFLKFYLVDRVHPNKERYWKKIYTDAEAIRGLFQPLSAFDEAVLRRLPFLGRMCWTTVITLTLPKKPT